MGDTVAGETVEVESNAEKTTEGMDDTVALESEEQERAEEDNSDDEVKEEDHQLLETLFVASDFQYEEGWPDPADTLSQLLSQVNKDGYKIDNAIICGDYTNLEKLYNYETSPEDSIREIKEIFISYDSNWNCDDMVFVQGNHDAMTESLNSTGLYEFDDYLVYVLDTQYDYPWKQGKMGLEGVVYDASLKMKETFDELIAMGEKRPVIIAGHVPLHYTARTSPLHTTGDNLYSSYIFHVVNEAAKDLNCVYLFGHNHSKGWDSYMGGSCIYRGVGDSILIPEFETGNENTSEFTKEELNFTYLNAGYLGYVSDCGADDTLTCTIFEIYDDEVSVVRYSKTGIYHLSAEGDANPYVDDSELISSNYYGEEVVSPQIITLK
jgi:predicted phosphodiesterase